MCHCTETSHVPEILKEIKIISAREYPQNVYQDLKYFIRLMYDNWLRLYTILTPWHALFFHDNVDPREVPEDPANFHLSQINSWASKFILVLFSCVLFLLYHVPQAKRKISVWHRFTIQIIFTSPQQESIHNTVCTRWFTLPGLCCSTSYACISCWHHTMTYSALTKWKPVMFRKIQPIFTSIGPENERLFWNA